MGNSIGCSASGERLVSAAREGDFVEAEMLLDSNPGLAKYSTFGGLNSPLHFAAAKGHNEIVALLLENGADVNSRNYSGQTALMQACRYGHWEVVQTLLLYRCNVTKADYLNGRTALHFATVNGHVRCVRLVLADFVPSAPFESWKAQKIQKNNNGSNNKTNDLFKFVNKAADGGVTALHMAALNGYIDCVQLLLDLHANISATTFNYGTTMDLIGAGSTPLHYAACGGNLKCTQILVARGASRLALNCNGWLPVDVTRIWGRHWLESLLAPNSVVPVPTFPPSNYLSLPLLSVLNIARDAGSKLSDTPLDEADTCAVCLERACGVAAEGCEHELCVRCALYLCSSSNIPSEPSMPPGSIPCPLCRHGITYFIKTLEKDVKLTLSDVLCVPDTENNSLDSVSSERFCPVTSCSPLSSVASPQCACREAHRSSFDSRESQPQESSEREITDMVGLEKTTYSIRLWGSRRSKGAAAQC